MNKKTIGMTSVLAVTFAIVASTGFVFLQEDEEQQKYNPGLIPPSTPIKKLTAAETVLNMSKVKELTGYEVQGLFAKSGEKSAKILPNGYKVQLVMVNKESKATTILVSKNPATENTGNNEFIWEDKGIFVSVKKLDPDIHTKERLPNMLMPFQSDPVSINGYDGFAHEIVTQDYKGEVTHSPAELVFYKDDKLIVMQGLVPVEELIAVAEML